ncbi:HAMP domain-containing histidine kinase [Georgenia sp. EYE_87]|uniref:sensor histidine kinase n=1 Tax=Georgenia sp. EYE_87 TaxID=2853448 RepID=UPI00200664E0|nr:HAMP domain-containing sensor histidine kinase [Georgenia sp. EYE_87]MCK6212522.1 HAMP domain-containing histidine kinase [Georgenia sp. EYE_87]
MNRLWVRLLLSHAVVAVVAGLTAYLVVRVVAPQLYDHEARMMAGHGMLAGRGMRAVAVAAMNNALLIGVLAGVAAALVAGAYGARRIMLPLEAVSSATHQLAAGRYDQRVALPRERELAAVAEDVNTLAERLAETEARRVRLIGEVAHEMRTPLTVLDGYVEGLVDGVFAPGPQVLDEMSAEVRRLRRLAEDLSALSRAEEGRLDLRPVETDLARVAAAAAERLRPQVEDAGVELAVEAGPPVPLRGDPDRLAQVVTNLVGNALAATPAGGRIVVRAAHRDGQAQVEVADTGVGLAEADLDRVFERFYRVGPRAGSGIGLTISRKIAEAHGGTLAAASAGPGRGATFTLRVPAGAPGA